MTVRLPRDLARAVVEHARAEYPLEACGLLAGRRTGPDREAAKIYPLPNIAKSRCRFDMDPRDQLKAVLDMRRLGLDPLGNYHSHPDTPARPSEEDLKLFLDPGAAYLIVSLAEDPPAVKAFAIPRGGPSPEGPRAIEEPLEIVEPLGDEPPASGEPPAGG